MFFELIANSACWPIGNVWMLHAGISLQQASKIEEQNKTDDWREELFMFYSEWHVGIRTDRYKYITTIKEEGHIELYDLQTDPKEL